jgi:hypothetical protein
LRKINISDTFFFTSSSEAPKVQRPPETFVPLRRRLYCGIWWDMEGIIHYELLERNLTTAERYCQQLGRLEEAIQQKRPGRRY